MKKSFYLIYVIVCSSFFVQAQDTLRTLDGRILNVKINEISEDGISFERVHKTRLKFATLERQEVFSYTPKGKNEILVYDYNPEIGNIYEIQEMRSYMVGERHADLYYRPLASNIIALGSGVWAGYAMANGNHVAIAVPLVAASFLLVPGTKVKNHVANEKYQRNGAYHDGYKRVAKGKKFLDALKFSGLGMLGSFLIFEAID